MCVCVFFVDVMRVCCVCVLSVLWYVKMCLRLCVVALLCLDMFVFFFLFVCWFRLLFLFV